MLGNFSEPVVVFTSPGSGLSFGQGAGWLVGWLVGCLLGWLLAWLVGWLVGRPGGWATASPASLRLGLPFGLIQWQFRVGWLRVSVGLAEV